MRRWIGALFAGTTLIAACGSNGLPNAFGSSSGTSGSNGTSSGISGGTSSSSGEIPAKSDTCTELQRTENCDCVDVKVLTDQPNLYFVLDRSGSMDENNKWGTMKSTVTEIVRAIGNRAKFGAAIYPSNSTACLPGGQVYPPIEGDTPGATGTTVNGIARAISVPAGGATPTAATLKALLPTVKSFTGRTFVILATDGAPNCGTGGACNADSCILNIEGYTDGQTACVPTGPSCCGGLNSQQCVDGDATESIVAQYAAAGIPVYVIGVPGSQAYDALLERIATTGGTARAEHPYYYRVETTEKEALTAALRKVAAKITATCEFVLTGTVEQQFINVYLDGQVVKADAANGWTLNDNKVTLVGTSCAKVTNGDVLNVQVVSGCPTQLK